MPLPDAWWLFPEIDVLSAMALVVAIGIGATFASGRNLAARLGLVLRQIDDRRQAAPGWDQACGATSIHGKLLSKAAEVTAD